MANTYWLLTLTRYFSNRIVVYGDDMLASIVPNSAKPFNFHKEFDMTEEMVSW